jgi:hypothetical protein
MSQSKISNSERIQPTAERSVIRHTVSRSGLFTAHYIAIHTISSVVVVKKKKYHKNIQRESRENMDLTTTETEY